MLAVESSNSPNVRERFLSDCSCSLRFVGRKLSLQRQSQNHICCLKVFAEDGYRGLKGCTNLRLLFGYVGSTGREYSKGTLSLYSPVVKAMRGPRIKGVPQTSTCEIVTKGYIQGVSGSI